MKFVKKFEVFVSENNSVEAEPTVKPDVKPGTTEKPQHPNPIRRERISPVPAPAKALKKATAEDVANRFIELVNKSGDDIKKYVDK